MASQRPNFLFKYYYITLGYLNQLVLPEFKTLEGSACIIQYNPNYTRCSSLLNLKDDVVSRTITSAHCQENVVSLSSSPPLVLIWNLNF